MQNLPKLFAASLATFTLLLAVPTSAQMQGLSYAPKDWKLPEADSQKWAARITALCPPQGWTVTAKANDIIIQRDKPVKFGGERFGPAAANVIVPKVPPVEGFYRLTLRFGPQMSMDRFEELSAQNVKTAAEDMALWEKYKFSTRSDGVMVPARAMDEEYEERQRAYRKASEHLIYTSLPQLYTTDYSITLYQSWPYYQRVMSGDAAVDQECNDVNAALARYFGCYETPRTGGKTIAGREEPKDTQ